MECCWFEVFQCLRKAAIIGVPALFKLGSTTQMGFGLMVCFVATATVTGLKP